MRKITNTMSERKRFELPEPNDEEDVIGRVAFYLNINPDAQPIWGDREPVERNKCVLKKLLLLVVVS